MKNKALLLVVVILVAIQLISCGKNSIEGKYANEKNPKETIEIKNGHFLFQGLQAPYEIKENKVYISVYGKKSLFAEIINSSTLKIGNRILKKVD